MSSAAPLGVADIERLHDKTRGKLNFLQMYGMTEASPLILCQSNRIKGGVKIGGSGLLLPDTKAKIVTVDDTENRNLGVHKSGELLIKGRQVMKGYHKNEEATRATIVDDGWLRTGDIGHYDEDGQFFITDRLKELIKVKSNIASKRFFTIILSFKMYKKALFFFCAFVRPNLYKYNHSYKIILTN